MPSIKHLLLIVLLSSNFFMTENLKCYQCRSDKDKGCKEDPFLKKYIKECSSEPTEDDNQSNPDDESNANDKPKPETKHEDDLDDSTLEPGLKSLDKNDDNDSEETHGKWKCRKIVQTLYVTDPYYTVYFRECVQSFGKSTCTSPSNKLFSLTICDCDEEACNGVQTVTTKLTFKVLMFLVFVLVFCV